MSKKKNRNPGKRAPHGEKMIEVSLRFWTNHIADEEGQIIPKHAWSAGVARIERNVAHGIKPGPSIQFHTLLDVGTAIQEVLIRQGIVLHPGRVMEKYVTSDMP